MTRWYQAAKDLDRTPQQERIRDVYIAAPFFKPEHIVQVERIENALRECGFSFFSPRFDCRYRPGDPDIVADRAFFLNKLHIDTCKFMIADLTYKDMGTSWELGYADKAGTVRLGVTSNMMAGLNLMVVNTVNALIPFRSLESCIRVLATDIIERGRGSLISVEGIDMSKTWEGEIE